MKLFALATVIPAFVSAQWGAEGEPPAVSCGNHFEVDPNAPLDLYTMIMENYEISLCNYYGAIRKETELEYDEMDGADIEVKV